MDHIIAGYPGSREGDLVFCRTHGVAYQADMRSARVDYDETYWDKVMAYEGSDIQRRVLEGRLAILRRQASRGWSVLDIGAGSGTFVRMAVSAGYYARGYDIMANSQQMLKSHGLFDEFEHLGGYDVVTMWDSLEHFEDPQTVMQSIARGSLLLVSIPIFARLEQIRKSKHYRPGEHLYYFTLDGLIDWAKLHGFSCREASKHEIEAGREGILAFAFVKDREPVPC